MRSVLKFVAGALALSAVSGAAFAAGALPPSVPEPGSLALVGVAVAALVAARKGKK